MLSDIKKEAEVAYNRIIEFIKNKGLKVGEYA